MKLSLDDAAAVIEFAPIIRSGDGDAAPRQTLGTVRSDISNHQQCRLRPRTEFVADAIVLLLLFTPNDKTLTRMESRHLLRERFLLRLPIATISLT